MDGIRSSRCGKLVVSGISHCLFDEYSAKLVVVPEQTDLIPACRGIETEAIQLSPRAVAPICFLNSCEQPSAKPENAADLDEDGCLVTLLFVETRY